MKRLLLSAALTAIFVAGCGSDNKSTNGPQAVEENNFAAVYNQVLGPQCSACHGLAGGLDVAHYATVTRYKAEIRDLVLEKKTMPPKAKLTAQQLETLRKWFAFDMPQGDAKPAITPRPQPIALAPTYESIRENILVPKCQVCHSSVGRVSRIPLEKVEDIVGKHVTPGKPDESALFDVITQTGRRRMPPAKSKIAPLSTEEIAAVREWIVQGAKP